MPEVYTEIATSFTTADTTSPVTVAYDGQELVVSFTNYGTQLQQVVFSDVRAFSWTGWDDVPAEAACDSVYELAGSTFLRPWESFAVGDLRFRHFKLGFNAEGKFLDVIATRMEQKMPNQTPEPTPPAVTPRACARVAPSSVVAHL